MSGRLGSDDGVAGTVDSPTSAPVVGNNGMDDINAAGGRDETAEEDEPAAAADVIPVQEEKQGEQTIEVCGSAALVSIPNKPTMYRPRTCATRHGCALTIQKPHTLGPDNPVIYDGNVAIQTDRTYQRPGHIQLNLDLNHPRTRRA